MRRVIVTTTINAPTPAIERFDAMPGWELVVVGDLKTPPEYRLARGQYVTPAMQERRDPALSEAIGWNCIQRRNFGLLWAHDMRADVVALVDDDNVPSDAWGRELLLGRSVETSFYETALPAFDPVGATNYPALWHRGFPIPWLARRDYARRSRRVVPCDVQADFWDGDPDVDALCRMEHAPECRFDPGCFPIASDKMAPFNSQNTFIRGEMLADYFLFPHVGRMDDIWAAYYVQAKGWRVVFSKASVFHARNAHDLVEDFKRESLGYERNHELVRDLAADPERIFDYLPEAARRAFTLYRKNFEARGA